MVTPYRTAVPGTSGTRIRGHSLPVPATARAFALAALPLAALLVTGGALCVVTRDD
jgi:hypothetical protein